MGVTITKQPQSIAVANGEYVHISFTAEGEGLIYEWYYKNKDSTTFRKTTAYTSNRYELAMDASRDGRKVYCVVTDAEGNSVQTDTVAMYMTDKRGLVPMAIMSDIAKAIRAKARISEQMLPPEMAAMIEGISAEVYSGSYTLSGNAATEWHLGTSIPEYDSYMFMVFRDGGSARTCGFNVAIDGVLTQGVVWDDEGKSYSFKESSGVILINFESGVITCPGLRLSSGTNHWYYFEVKGASA